MKKVLLLAMSFCMLNAGYSVYGGLAYTGSKHSESYEGETEKSVAGFTIGGSMDAGPVKVGVGFTPRATGTDYEGYGSATMTQNYLELWTAYPYEAGPVVLYGGFMLGMAMGDGKFKDTPDEGDAVSGSVKKDCGDDGECYPLERAAMDYGLMFGATYPINETMSVSAGYYLGLADATVNEEGDDTTDKWSGIYATFGYSF